MSSSSRARNFSRRVVRFLMAYSASAKVNWLMVFTGWLGLLYCAKFWEFFRGSLDIHHTPHPFLNDQGRARQNGPPAGKPVAVQGGSRESRADSGYSKCAILVHFLLGFNLDTVALIVCHRYKRYPYLNS